MNIALSIDERYTAGAIVLMATLEKYNCVSNYYIFHEGLPERHVTLIRNTFPDSAIEMLDIRLPSHLQKMGWITRVASARVLIPEFVPGDRCMYIDADVICRTNLNQLYQVDLKGLPLAATIDDYDTPDVDLIFKGYWDVPLNTLPDSAWPSKPLPMLFSTGFMLMDLEAWRRENLSAKYFDWVLAHQSALHLPLQAGLNKFINGRFVRFPDEVQASILCHGEGAKSLDVNSVSLIHYAGPKKPWEAPSKEFKTLWDLWWREAQPVLPSVRAACDGL